MDHNLLRQKAFLNLRQQYFLNRLPVPILIFTVLVVLNYFVGKRFFDGIHLENHILSFFLIIALIAYSIWSWVHIPFAQEEMDAWIDKHLKAGGLFMTVQEGHKGQWKWEDQLNKFLYQKENDLPAFPYSNIFRCIFLLSAGVILIYLIPVYISPLLNDSSAISKLMLEEFKEEISEMEKEGILSEKEEIDDLKDYLKELEEKANKEGMSNSVWEARDRLEKLMEKKNLEQLSREQHMASNINDLMEALQENENLEKLSKELNSLESELLKEQNRNHFSANKIDDLLQQMQSMKQKMPALKPEDLQNIMSAMKKMNDSVLKQCQSRQMNPKLSSNKKGLNKLGQKSLQSELKKLAEKLKASEEGICKKPGGKMGNKPGHNGINRGPGSSTIEYTNDTKNKDTKGPSILRSSGVLYNNDGELKGLEKGKHQESILGDESLIKKEFNNTDTDITWQNKLPPHRRKIVKKHFQR